jgi:precorrin-6A/cobalt-precorrin-6A reductase
VNSSGYIWLIGGTRDSAELARTLLEQGIAAIVSVTTESARSLYPPDPALSVWVGKLDRDRLPQFLGDRRIRAIVDASHPHAVEISQLAIAASREFSLPYLRYERPEIPDREGDRVQYFDSFAALVAGETLAGRRVLLTIGYRYLSLFRPWQRRSTLFARILPSQTALQAALDAGFTGDRLIALRPPISLPLERALWQQWQLTAVVTKASGSPGGEHIKRQLAAELGIDLLAIRRPQLDYPQQTQTIDRAIAFCHYYR